MWDISYLISNTVTARKLKFYKHLGWSSASFGNNNFSARGRLRDAVPPSVNLGPLISRFLFVGYFATNHSYVFYSCIPSPRLLSNVVVSYVKDSHYSTLRCCLVELFPLSPTVETL